MQYELPYVLCAPFAPAGPGCGRPAHRAAVGRTGPPHGPGGFEKALAAVRLLRVRGVDVKLNGSVTPENVGEMDRLYAIAHQLDVPMHMDAYMMPGGAGATALTERTAGTARLLWARWAAGIRTAGSSGSDRMRGAAEGRSTPHFLWQKCCPVLAGAGRAC